jgi:hypothetical protein
MYYCRENESIIDAVQSKQFIEKNQLYNNLTALLQLFPDFIVQFESLLIDTELTQIKEGELLNTELRIVALIRLYNKDSAKIATFLDIPFPQFITTALY